MKKRIGFLLIPLFFIVIFLTTLIVNKDIPLLLSENGAHWIRFPEPFGLKARQRGVLSTIFAGRFYVDNMPLKAEFFIRARMKAKVYLNNQLVLETGEDFRTWKKKYTIDLKPFLKREENIFVINVEAKSAHPALLAYCEGLNIKTGKSWGASKDGIRWSHAMLVEKIAPTALSRKFKRTDEALASNSVFFLIIFLGIILLTFWAKKGKIQKRCLDKISSASYIRWCLLILFVILGINNMFKLKMFAGMDVGDHYDYIFYIIKHWRVPFAYEGWQTFQPPLFYFISALFLKGLNLFLSVKMSKIILRFIPIICGACQIEICYRILKRIYPERNDLQVMGTLLGGLLPMNIYISQVVGNEPLTGLLTSIVIMILLYTIISPRHRMNKVYIILGTFFGLALLTKVTPILLILPIFLLIAYQIFSETGLSKTSIMLFIRRICIVFGIAAIISGWYYIRNKIVLGRFFMGGWDLSGASEWWQDPSYRTLSHLTAFGETLFYPIYSSIFGIWNSLYSTFWLDGGLSGICAYGARPHWNYDMMLSCVWLSILPSIALMIGVIIAFSNPGRLFSSEDGFAGTCVIIYLGAVFYLFLKLPIYSTAKATYTLGLIPCYAVLFTTGLKWIMDSKFPRTIVYGIMACWAVGVYMGYFVL